MPGHVGKTGNLDKGYSVIIWQGAPALLVNLHDITKHEVRGITIQQERDRLLHENLTLRATMKDRYRLGEIIGEARRCKPCMR